MPTNSRPAIRRAGVGRFRPVLLALVVSVVAAPTACGSTVAGSPVAATGVVGPSPQAPSPVAPPSPSPAGSRPTTSTGPTSSAAASPMSPSDPSTEVLTVTTYPSTAVTEPSPSSASRPSTGTGRSTGPVTGSGHRGTAALVAGGGVQVHVGSPKLKIEIYDEPLCPPCAQFAHRFGPAIDKAVDAGTLTVTYRTLTFLDDRSFSGSYSTRAGAALLCVARSAGSQPGLFQDFYAELFTAEVQPEEDGERDLTDDELAELAERVGAPDVAVGCIRAGSEMAAAARADAAGEAALSKAGASGTPAVVHDGTIVDHDDPQWLTGLLAGG